MPLSFVTDCSNIAKAERKLDHRKLPTNEVAVTFIGLIPKTLDLGLWGKFPIRSPKREPLRCYNCQRYGHHKEECRNPTICGVCSHRHPTQDCIDAHRNGIETQAKCPNCAGPHHAWNKKCPEFLKRLPTPLAAPPNKPETAPRQTPKPQRIPRTRPPRRPSEAPPSGVPTAATNQEPSTIASPVDEPTSSAVNSPPHPPAISSILSLAEALPVDTLIPLVLQLLVKVCSLAQTPSTVIQSLLSPLVSSSLVQG
ncbi:uncharacterized protein [Palaemon carinicauda]|uniref:uncharacterized protein n=1 Tax=Palaemon carinicauda TaxID=392227 RepID=UPI0035B6A780